MDKTHCAVIWVSHHYIQDLSDDSYAVILHKDKVIEGKYKDIWQIHLQSNLRSKIIKTNTV